MKVFIGPYKNWIGPYQIADKLFFWVEKCPLDSELESRLDYRLHDKFGKWLSETWIDGFCNWLDSKKKRKIEVKIHNYDTWGMYSTLAIIVLPMLRQLKETKHGSPCDMPAFSQTSNSSQLCFDFYQIEDDLAWDAGHKQWEEILDKMIWSFEQLQPDCDWEGQYTIIQPELDLSDYPEDEGKISVPVRWKTKGEIDWVGREKHSIKIQEGLELFGKYFQNLWD